ncbi:MAG: DUF4214 domain-containing protein [Planctomycetes bacterium]|nr:DUF4214 domain-containing protein [Planctomycetota bacterium]
MKGRSRARLHRTTVTLAILVASAVSPPARSQEDPPALEGRWSVTGALDDGRPFQGTYEFRRTAEAGDAAGTPPAWNFTYDVRVIAESGEPETRSFTGTASWVQDPAKDRPSLRLGYRPWIPSRHEGVTGVLGGMGRPRDAADRGEGGAFQVHVQLDPVSDEGPGREVLTGGFRVAGGTPGGPRDGAWLASWEGVETLRRAVGAAGAAGSGTPEATPPRTLGERVVDPGGLRGLHLLGYQGWFTCRGDGSPVNDWTHWFRDGKADIAHATVDLWPEVSELDPGELHDTGLTLPGGAPARVFSAFDPRTVERHFRWMREHDLDGVFFQRFSSELRDPRFYALRDRVLENVRAGAERNGRVFAIMYDVSGHPPATVVEDLERDWAHLVDDLKVTESPRYLRDRGRPLMAIWGFGVSDRGFAPAQAAARVRHFKDDAAPRHRVTLLGGVPWGWRDLVGDSDTDPGWAPVYRSFDALSPWTVGRYESEAGADDYMRKFLVPDLEECRRHGMGYMPVVFPGFSWHHLLGGPSNQIPRRGGAFYWRQVYNVARLGSGTMFGAMFDEVDEGTAMFKIAPTRAEQPVEGKFVPLDVDGLSLPSDWYLRLAGEAGRMLRGERPLTERIPISPGGPANRAYIAALHRAMLGRPATTLELEEYGRRLDAGEARLEVARDVLRSPGALEMRVEEAYRRVLHRPADPSGRQTYVAALSGGLGLKWLLTALATSDEYRAGHPSTDSFVEGVYGDLLGRASDPGGKAFHASMLDAGRMDPSGVARSLLDSEEFHRRYVAEAYRTVLGRVADPGGLAAHAAHLDGGMTLLQLLEVLAASEEFFLTAGGPAR